jgi:hypothetical protein
MGRSLPSVAGVCLALALTGGCELVEVATEEGEDVLVVEGVLRTDRLEQSVLVHRSLRSAPLERLEWVSAELGFPDGAVRSFAPTPGCIAEGSDFGDAQPWCLSLTAADHPVVPGETYELRVESSDGRRLFGRTRVPGALQMVTPSAALWMSPAEEAICSLPPWTPLVLRWRATSGAWAYIAELELYGLAAALGRQDAGDLPDPLRLSGLAIGASDTTMVLPGDFALFQWGSVPVDVLLQLQQGLPAGVSATLVLAAADRNYVNGVRGGNFNPSGSVRIPSVFGDGTGMFGSLSARTLAIEVAEQGAFQPCIS